MSDNEVWPTLNREYDPAEAGLEMLADFGYDPENPPEWFEEEHEEYER